MDRKSTLNREPEPFYKTKHKAWYVEVDGKQRRLCQANERTDKVPLEGQLEWHATPLTFLAREIPRITLFTAYYRGQIHRGQ